jgi:rubrerythrin
MNEIELFLAHAIYLERDAARRYEELTSAMKTAGNHEAEVFFKQMAEFARLHMKDAMKRGGFRDIPVVADDEWQWPDGTSPETAGWAGVDDMIDIDRALMLALDGEERSLSFYGSIADTTKDPEVRHMARIFANEESEHVIELQRWITRRAA